MKKSLVSMTLSFFLLTNLFSQVSELNKTTVFFDSDEGWNLLLESNYRCDYWHLSRYFETQMTYAHCSVASVVMVLNALGVKRPNQAKYKNYPLFTQDSFFTEPVKKIVKPEDVARRGMTIEEVTQALNTYDVEAKLTYGTMINPCEFRKLLKKVLRTTDKILIADFYRPTLNQAGTGHFSPIAAYNENEDKVLILEVSRYKHPPFWVDLEVLIKAMCEKDSSTNNPRGYILVSKK